MTNLVPEKRIADFENMGFGMFIHWGLYSQMNSGEWIQNRRSIPKNDYIKLKDTFTAKDFDADLIAKTAKRAGAKYITLTTRHHEGFSLYDTKGLSDFDAVHSPAGRDLVAEFVTACRSEEIIPMFYHTTLDWYQESFQENFDEYLEYLRKSVEILCTNYGKIGGLWFDGNWSKPDADWKLDELYGTIRKHQPEAMIINNTGLSARGEIGHPEIDSVTFEQGLPQPMDRAGMSKYISGEMCYTLNDHWGVAYNDFNYKSMANIIESLCLSRMAGANYLLNIGPTPQGGVELMQQAMLDQVGRWMDINGKAIYEGRPCEIIGQGKDFALKASDGSIYLFIFDLNINGDANVTVDMGNHPLRSFAGFSKPIQNVTWLDNNEKLDFTQNCDNGLFTVHATANPYGQNLVVRVAKAE